MAYGMRGVSESGHCFGTVRSHFGKRHCPGWCLVFEKAAHRWEPGTVWVLHHRSRWWPLEERRASQGPQQWRPGETARSSRHSHRRYLGCVFFAGGWAVVAHHWPGGTWKRNWTTCVPWSGSRQREEEEGRPKGAAHLVEAVPSRRLL